MRQSAHRPAEAVLALVIVGLLIVEVVPWGRAPLPVKAAAGSAVAPTAADPPVNASSALPIETVLRLFAERSVASVRTPAAPPEAKPQEAPWLKYMGFASTADGASSWYVKDTKTGRMMRVSRGEARGGWVVVESTADRLVLKNGGDLYSVRKR